MNPISISSTKINIFEYSEFDGFTYKFVSKAIFRMSLLLARNRVTGGNKTIEKVIYNINNI